MKTSPIRARRQAHGTSWSAAHPETGRRTLFLGRRRNSYVEGLQLAESEALLDALWTHATQAQFVFRQQWRVGDVVVWDNRCTLHRRDPSIPPRGA
jgi:taurine dioxygenase